MSSSGEITRRQLCRQLAWAMAGLAVGGPLASQAKEKAAPPKKPAVVRKFESKVIWEFDGCWDHPRMLRVKPIMHNSSVYAVIWLPELKTHVVKVPLGAGTKQLSPLMPGHVTGEDPHRSYVIAADSAGRIHVTGDMHGSAWVKHWLSQKPEEVTAFDFACGAGSNLGPQGAEVTYPAFFKSPDGVLYHSIRCGKPAMGAAVSVLDAKTQTWSVLGASITREQLAGQRKNMAAKTDANPLTVWEDNGEGGDYKYMQPHAKLAWDRKKRLHIVCSVLNKNTPSAKGRHTHTHVLYAYSDDGGKTIHRGDGTEIRWPMRAEEGPHQGDVVHAESEGNPPWLSVAAGLKIDDQDRPVVSCLSFKTGKHSKVLEKGKWLPVQEAPSAAPGKPAEDDEDGFDFDGDELADYGLTPHERQSVSMEHFRATGEALFITFPSLNKRRDKGFNRIQFVVRSPIKEK